MKKWVLPFAVLATLTACSGSNKDKQAANDSYQKTAGTPTFVKLETGGVTLPEQDPTYQLPNIEISISAAIDIRPPTKPMAIIGDSVAQFDGERSSIVYPAEKKAVYNLQQVQRLLTEQNIKFTQEGNSLLTDWAPTGRNDDVGNTQIRYKIDELGNAEANALAVSVVNMKRNDIIFTPSATEKQRYTSDRLNQLIGELNSAYRTQRQQLQLLSHNPASAQTSSSAPSLPLQREIVTDSNGRTELALSTGFNQSWEKLAQVLPQLGFKIEEEHQARGYRELYYKPIDEKEWLRFGVARPKLKKGDHFMQLTTNNGNQSAVVLSNKDKEALTGDNAQSVYQALQALMSQ